mgnify:CR=1 FL=1
MPNRFCNTSLLQVQSGWTLGIPSVRSFPGQKDLAGYILTGFPGQMDLASQIVTGFPGQMDLAGQIATGKHITFLVAKSIWLSGFAQKTHHNLEARLAPEKRWVF